MTCCVPVGDAEFPYFFLHEELLRALANRLVVLAREREREREPGKGGHAARVAAVRVSGNYPSDARQKTDRASSTGQQCDGVSDEALKLAET